MKTSIELGPEEMSLLEKCPHFSVIRVHACTHVHDAFACLFTGT